MDKPTMSGDFKSALEASSANNILSPAYRRKKLTLWSIRTAISIVLYIIFWEYTWLRWTLLLTVPLSLFSLFTIMLTPYLLKKKIARTKQKVEEAEVIIRETIDQ